MHAVFRIELLGRFHLTYDDVPILVNSIRLQSLLAYLVIFCHAPQPRRQIAFLLWPDSTESQAHTNLRRELHHLRRVLPMIDHFLEIDNAFVRWRPNASFTLDVANFKRLLVEAEAVGDANHLSPKLHILQQAVDSYHGRLLPDCYDEWLLPLREELEQLFVHALEQLVTILEGQRDYTTAIRVAERLLHHDRLLESTYRRLMRLHALNKDRARALRVYHDCCAILEQELGVEPASETQAVYALLLHAEEVTPVRTEKPLSLAVKTTLVGRQDAWHTLLSAYRLANSGHTHMVLISGEAGIGKSRLAEELLLWAEQQGTLTARSRAYMAQGSLAYSPIIEILRTETLRTRWSKLSDVWLGELVWLLPELQETRPDLSPAPLPAEHLRRRRMMEALARALLAGDEPRILVFDDLQWCDQETLELIEYLLSLAPRTPLLLVGTARPEEITLDHPLTTLRRNLHREEQLIEIELGPLTAEETNILAAQVGSGELRAETATQLYQQTEGNPLFIVETVRAELLKRVLVDTAESSNELVAPRLLSPSPKIYAVIQSRLAQLSPFAQKLVSFAATIGRSFTLTLLIEASGENEEEVVHSLDELWQRRIIRTQGINAYDFSHDRIRDVAYAAISPIRLPQMHRQIAVALENTYADALEAIASQLAAHYEQAGLTEKAIGWHQRAAEMHRRLHTAREAVKHLKAGLALLERVPESSARNQQEITLLLALSDSLTIAKGLTAPGLLPVLDRARNLLQKNNDQRQLFLVLQRLQNFHRGHHGVHVARELCKNLLEIAQELGDPLLQSMALRAAGAIHRSLGEFANALANQEQALALFQMTTVAVPLGLVFEGDRGIAVTLGNSALSLGIIGYVDQARVRVAKALLTAEAEAIPYTLTNTLFLASLAYQIIGDIEKVRELSERLLSLGAHYELPMSVWCGKACQGWVLASEGDLKNGIAQMEEANGYFRQIGHIVFQPCRLGMVADFYIQASRLDDAEAALQEALLMSKECYERLWDAEIHRLCGDLAHARGEPDVAVEHHYLQAVELACTQQSKSLELRAATGLARLWSKQGEHTKAYTILSETLNWFTEGFDTVGFKTAVALRAELSRAQHG